jgi:hypothetical protein
MRKKSISLILFTIFLVGLLAGVFVLNRSQPVSAAPDAPDIFASPVQAGCYIAAPNDCRIHVDPFTINISSGKKLGFFQLVAIQSGTGTQTAVYDFHTDQSNPAPSSGITYSPSLVAQDFGATCGKSYMLSLQGKDSGDTATYNLGLTSQFTCPSRVP